MAQPVLINLDNPTVADIREAVARPAGQGYPSYVFMAPNMVPIDGNFVLTTLRDMFASQGPLDPVTNQARSIPWVGGQGHNYVESALCAIGVPVPPYDQVIHGQGPATHTNADRNAMKIRIGGVKKTLMKILGQINKERLATAAGNAAPVVQQAAAAAAAANQNAAAANQNAAQANAQAAAANINAANAVNNAAPRDAIERAYARGYADAEAALVSKYTCCCCRCRCR